MIYVLPAAQFQTALSYLNVWSVQVDLLEHLLGVVTTAPTSSIQPELSVDHVNALQAIHLLIIEISVFVQNQVTQSTNKTYVHPV